MPLKQNARIASIHNYNCLSVTNALVQERCVNLINYFHNCYAVAMVTCSLQLLVFQNKYPKIHFNGISNGKIKRPEFDQESDGASEKLPK